jgi:putative nucleotidyltransferase with HDIG domain
MGYLPRMVGATLVVTVLPGLAAGALQAVGLVHSWVLSAGVAVVLSMGAAALGSAWWARRPASRDIVFADLMLWGWLRRVRTERRLASARWLLGSSADLDPARKTALLERLSAALEGRDLYTHGHSRRVTRHAYRIARQLGLPAEESARIRTAAAVHDVGKIETPREVLNKPDRLSDDEFAIIKRHPVDGARMVAALGDDELTAMVRHHHERLDGRGYPDGLAGEDIPLGARVIAVADTFDALTSNRPYRPGCRHKKALDILRKEAGAQLDPDAVAAFLGYYSGRRAIPLWSTVAAAPSRLAAWILSGVQGATAAPLGGGAASLGAAFLVGATLAGSPATGEAARPAKAEARKPAAVRAALGEREERRAARASERTAAPRAKRRGSGPRERGPRRRSTPGERRGGDGGGGSRRLVDQGQGGSASPGVEAPAGQVQGGSASGPNGDPGGGDRGVRLPEAPKLPNPPAGGGGGGGATDPPRTPDKPGVELPAVEVPSIELPAVETPQVELPGVEVGPVQVPKVQVPSIEVPSVKLPPVQLPPLRLR